MNTLLLCTLAVLLIAALGAFAVERIKHSATKADLLDEEATVARLNEELKQVRTRQAHKVDRALWFLVKVRADRSVSRPPQLIREPLHLNVDLDVALVDAYVAAPEQADSRAIVEVVGEHLARRVARMAPIMR